MNTPLIPFHAGSPIMISGPTASGKTYWTCKLLTNEMFTEPIASVLYCYGVYQDYYNEMTIPNIEFHEGLLGFPLGTGKPGKMGRHFPVREKSGNFDQTGKVRENHTKYWKNLGISDKYYLLSLVILK